MASVKQKSLAKTSYIDLILPFWKQKNNWIAWGIAAFLLFNMFGMAGIYVWSNKLEGKLIDALIAFKWSGIWPILLTLLFASIIKVGVGSLGFGLSDYLSLKWRTYMTEHFLNRWVEKHAYYSIERDNKIDNADQRIAQDIDTFVSATINLTTMIIGSTVNLISFTFVLWGLSGTINIMLGHFNLGIPGYMVYIAYFFSILGLLVTHLTGFPLIKLQNVRQSREADFRYSAMQLRENAEQIAFYNGGNREKQRMFDRFIKLRGNLVKIIFTTSNMMFWRDGFFTLNNVIATLAALPRYLVGAITLGQLTQVSGAFGMVVNSMATYPQAYQGLTNWLAIANRLRALSDAIESEKLQEKENNIKIIGDDTKQENSQINLKNIQIFRPNSELLLEAEDINFKQGEKWLINGQTGSGKSTFLRTIAGIWPFANGTIKENKRINKMFLPQRSYIPEGKLIDAISYPHVSDDFSVDEITKAMKLAQLEDLLPQLYEEGRWQQTLSGGEQQRLAFARAFLQKPDFLFLDEATSALDPITEQEIYKSLIKTLSNTSIISVAHRDSLKAYHDKFLEISNCYLTNNYKN